MAYFNIPFFTNDRKSKGTHPDYSSKFTVKADEVEGLREILAWFENHNEGTVEFAAWIKQSRSGNQYFSGSLKIAPEKYQEAAATSDDSMNEEVPF